MGIFLRLFNTPIDCKSQHIQVERGNLIIDDNDDNTDHYKINEIKEIGKNDKLLCLKIYILGTGDKKEYVINKIFRKDIADDYLKTIADKEFLTEQFHWIARIYNDKITKEKCEEIKKEIRKDKSSKQNKNKILKYQVILSFGNENTKILSENFINFRKNRMIFITDSECELDEKIDKRYVTNIISKDISNEQLNSKIISTLWELDCCYNEKGNQICRYTPEKIFNGLEKDNSLFSINILLTGLSRTGKSTFINLLSGKIIALEGDASESVTKNISEYYIYKDDDKDEHGAIKIIDTPGIVPNNNEYKNVEKEVIKIIKDQDKNFENQIHFIFFLLLKDSPLEGENILEILSTLNKSKCPVYFIINKVIENSELDFIDPMIEYLIENECENLADENKFITVNFKEDKNVAGNIHGIDKIFKKMYDHINEKKFLDKELNNKMIILLNDFRADVEPKESFISYKREDRIIIDNLKSSINYDKRIKEINDITSKNELFSKIELAPLILNGRKIAKKCRDVIISLSNLIDILPNSGDIPLLAIFQAFMVKEIGEGYGLDINVLNYGTKLFINNMNKKLISEDIDNNIKNNDINILDRKEIIKSLDIIKDKIDNKLEKKSNKDTILYLAKLLNKLKEMIKEKENNKNEQEINQNFTNDIYNYCLLFFEKELIESEGLCFMFNYFKKCELLLKDIEYYTKKTDWGKYNIEIRK